MDPLSISVSALTLATFCVNASASLYKTIESLKSHKEDVRNLKTEVGNLNIVLQALEKNIEESTENFEPLGIVLKQCGQACKGFQDTVLRALEDPNGRLQEIKNWAKLRYLGSDISEFKKLIGSYKATVTIALADANLRTTKATKQLLEKYTEMTEDTTSDLEDRIAELNKRLQTLQSTRTSTGGLDTESKDTLPIVQQAREQKAGLEQCLNICHSLLEHIEKVRASTAEDTDIVTGTVQVGGVIQDVNGLAPRLLSDALKTCTHNLNTAAEQLRDLREGQKPIDEAKEAEIMQQLDSARQCLDIVEKAQQHRVNVFENIKTEEDCFQTVVSTIGDLIKASGLTIGARSVNIMGQMNDDTLQKMVCNLRPPTAEKSTSEENNNAFAERHGVGRTTHQKMR